MDLLGKIVELKDGSKGRVVVCIEQEEKCCVAYLKPKYTTNLTSWDYYEEKFHFYAVDTKRELRLTKEQFEQVPVYGYDTYSYKQLIKVYGNLKSWFISSLEEKY